MSDYYFSTKDLSVGYNGKALITDINVELNKGQIMTLIGPNGSGKSTILKSISNHLRTIAGTVFIGDSTLHDMSYKDLSVKMAVVLTERIKVELMTCRDIVATGRYPYTGRLGLLTDEDNKKVDAAIKLVNAEEIAERDFAAISDGQRQRVMLARAICQEPEIIILDEPTSFLDIKHKLELLDILRRMVEEQNIVVIMSLHEIDLAQKVSDIIMCVKGDHVTSLGTPREIFTKDNITALYDINKGNYNMFFGSVELPRPEGVPETFIIAGNGTGIDIFREYQKKKVPFYAGVLHTNDLDYQVACDLAMEVVSVPAFEEIDNEAYEKAKALIDKCKTVVYTGVAFGTANRLNKDLLEYAKGNGKEILNL
ncbi:MAG: ABC transporter ATP-binding protein [Lachnospiraceae bacterium]|jgi:iron complex transport system ATP-binding protein|nr:ABC transporter ATP-binding protein [Lachnospiraceae bacterium]